MSVKGVIYLLHFDPPFKHAKHYLGWAHTSGWVERLIKHKAGSGSRLVQAAQAAGSTFRLARTWEDVDRNQERKWKISGNSRRCPICRLEKQICQEMVVLMLSAANEYTTTIVLDVVLTNLERLSLTPTDTGSVSSALRIEPTETMKNSSDPRRHNIG